MGQLTNERSRCGERAAKTGVELDAVDTPADAEQRPGLETDGTVHLSSGGIGYALSAKCASIRSTTVAAIDGSLVALR